MDTIHIPQAPDADAELLAELPCDCPLCTARDAIAAIDHEAREAVAAGMY